MCFDSVLKLTTLACSDFGYPELLEACKNVFQPSNQQYRNYRIDLLVKSQWLKLSLKALKAILDFNVYPKNQEQLLLAVKRWEEANAELATDAEMAEVYRKIRLPCIQISNLQTIEDKNVTKSLLKMTNILSWIGNCKRVMKKEGVESNIENEEKTVKSDNESVAGSEKSTFSDGYIVTNY